MLNRRQFARTGLAGAGVLAAPSLLRAQGKPLTKIRYSEVVRSIMYRRPTSR